MRGLDELEISLNQLAKLDEETKWSILEAGGKILRDSYEKYLAAFHHLTGGLEASIRLKKRTAGGQTIAQIAPSGKHPGSKTGKRMKKGKDGKRRSSGSYQGTNAEIAYFLEYGTPRMPAKHWMEIVNEETQEAVSEAMQEAWNKHLDDLGL